MDFKELMNLTGTGLPLATIIQNIMVTFILSFVIYLVYKATYSGVTYSKSFNVSIVMTTMVTSMVMMVIGNNLALSLGMVGALSIVRFRAAVKEPKDISYLFWGLAIGLSAGTGAYGIAVVGTIAMTAIVFIFHGKFTDGDSSYLLVIKGTDLYASSMTSKVTELTKRQKLKMQNTSTELVEFVFEVKIEKASEEKIVKAIREVTGVKIVNIVSYTGTVNG